MITIFGGHSPSFEEVGAMELLRSCGKEVTYLMPEDCGRGPFYAVRALLSRIGVDVEYATAEKFCKSDRVISFGREEVFDATMSFGEKPKTLVYGPDFTLPTAGEIQALASGLIDELFFKSRKYEVAFLKAIVSSANRGVEHRPSYFPFCNANSDITGLAFSKKPENFTFGVLCDVQDRADQAFPDFWRTLAAVTAPKNRKKQFVVSGWGQVLSEVAGDASLEGNKWHGEFNLGLFPDSMPVEKTGELYKESCVLLHYCPAESQAFAFNAVKAFISGSVVVCGPSDSLLDLIDHGKTGFFASSSDEASYLVSKLAWEPYLRAQVAAKAYNVVATSGNANADICLKWWKEGALWG